MGCDGGTIPRRDELVRVAKKPEQKDKESELAYKWRHCAITQQPLQEPIVMCGLGRLYSKQNVIENLLEKDKMPASAAHIKSLKDVKNLQLTPNPVYKDDDKTEGMVDHRSAPYICKLIGLEMTGTFRFVALWTCGCVFSERALKEIKSSNCSLCQTPFTDDDIVILNGNEEEMNLMLSKMEIRRAKLKAAKKDKKSKNKAEAIASSSTKDQQPVATTTTTSSSADLVDDSASSKSNGMLSSKASHSGVKPFLKREAQADALIDPAIKKLKDGVFSVAEDKSKSEVYKSLFTTHKSEQDQSRAHWVTYNLFYN